MPSVVRNIVVDNLLSGRRMLVEWDLNNVSESITAYEIWRSTTEYQGFQKVAEVPSPMYQYVDKVPFTFGIIFFYKVLARDNTGLRSDIHQTAAVQDSTFDDFEEAPFRATSVSFNDFIVGEVPSGVIDGVNATFTLANLFRFNTTEVCINGLVLNRATDYTENADQQTITLTTPAALYSVIVVNYITV